MCPASSLIFPGWKLSMFCAASGLFRFIMLLNSQASVCFPNKLVFYLTMHSKDFSA